MKTFPHLIVCRDCDTVYRRPRLAAGETARCETCEATLHGANRADIDGWLALTAAAAIVFAIANVCPLILIDLHGLHSEATLWQSVVALAHGASAPMALPAAMFIIVVPFLQIALLAWVLAYARAGRKAPGFAAAIRLLAALQPWSMVEVALLGVLVSIVKLSGYLSVAPGVGVWAVAALMVLITLIARRDVQQLWDLAERGGQA
ncbi:paraquat-inducible protein A [Trinickia violacea]|uniref:Paraquat-inducible protein A n=1 Tax=Trinickia violacea TaxID=2571746 RepID=A0A4P8J1R5_9BURK|nr:paraquat-inducible protein A [Trinickia violacea]QCP53654.1 paraquat-inducible protein A [Trinickia violacea]